MISGTSLPTSIRPTRGHASHSIFLKWRRTFGRNDIARTATLLQKSTTGSAVQRLYYQLRPLMGVGVRKHLQKVRLSGWDKIPFPRWPVDRTVDTLMESAMALVLKAQGQSSIPLSGSGRKEHQPAA